MELDRTASVFQADQLENPNNADWAINALAPAAADTNNAGLTVRLFDDTTEEGVGLSLFLPTASNTIRFRLISRAETAPGAAAVASMFVYARTVPDNAAVTAWSAQIALGTVNLPTNEFFQYDVFSLTLTALGLAPGTWVQLEITRDSAGGELTGDLAVLEISAEPIAV